MTAVPLPGVPFEVHDPAFRRLVHAHAALERLHTGCRWSEGPVWFADAEQLVWSDIPNDRLMRWVPGLGAGVLRERCGHHNGHARDRDGRLVSCEHGARRVTRLEPDGRVTVLADRHAGRRLNSPNDVVVARDGAIWFTDPDYGILTDYEGHRAEREQDGCHVYRIDPANGEVARMIDDMTKPNGLAFSPDERWLYVADSGGSHAAGGPHHVRRFQVADHGRGVRGGGILAEISPGLPDGLKVDVHGHLWCSAADGVHCLSPDGRLLGKVLVPEVVANLCFGGPRRNRLFIAATQSLYALYVATTGL